MTFAVPFLLALLAGAIGITRQAWRDEHATWRAATIPLSDLGDLLSRVDIVLAPYYLFMRAWVAVFGDSVVALRLPSLIAMATAAGLTGVLASRLSAHLSPSPTLPGRLSSSPTLPGPSLSGPSVSGPSYSRPTLPGRWVGVTAGSLFAVIPSVSRYAEEARPYAFAICFAVATVLALLARRWVLLALFVTLTGLAHLVALTVLLAHLPLLIHRRRSSRSRRAAAPPPGERSSRFQGNRGYAAADSNDFPENATITDGSAIIAGSAITDGSAITAGFGGGSGGEARAGVGEGDWWRWGVAVGVGGVLVVPLGMLGLGQSGQVEWIDANLASLGVLPASLARSGAVAGILGALAVLGVVASRVDRWWALLIVWVAAPPLVVFVVAPQFFYYRYLLFTLPAWAVLAAFGAYAAVRDLSRRRQAALAVGLCAAVLALGAKDHVAVRRSPLAGDQDYRGAAQYLAAHMSAGDSVYFAGYPDGRERLGFAYEMREGAAPDVCEELARCTGRVWQVTNGRVSAPEGFTELEAQEFPGIQLRLLRRS